MATALIPLDCDPSALERLAEPPSRIAAANAGMEWMNPAAFVIWPDFTLIASASPELRSDGTSVRRLQLAAYPALRDQLRAALPDIQLRAETRGSTQVLPDAPESLPIDASGASWDGFRTCRVVIRRSRDAALGSVACGLLFSRDDGPDLLLAADTVVIALVLSDDPALIAAYLSDCETVSLDDYQAMLA